MFQFFRKIKWQTAQFFEIRWWKSYLKNKNSSEYLEWKQGYWQTVLQKAGTKSPSLAAQKLANADSVENIIWDAGCGPAGIFTIFRKAKVFASDPLLNAYKTNALLFYSKAENVRFIHAPLENTELPQLCDIAFCMNALNHVQNIELATAQLAKQIKEDGLLVCTLDCHKSDFIKYIFRLVPGDLLHPHQHSLADYIALFEKFGLRKLSTSQIKKGNIFQHDLLVFSKEE